MRLLHGLLPALHLHWLRDLNLSLKQECPVLPSIAEGLFAESEPRQVFLVAVWKILAFHEPKHQLSLSEVHLEATLIKILLRMASPSSPPGHGARGPPMPARRLHGSSPGREVELPPLHDDPPILQAFLQVRPLIGAAETVPSTPNPVTMLRREMSYQVTLLPF